MSCPQQNGNAKARIIVVFHTNAGHVTLNDESYNSDRLVATGNPSRALLADLIKRGVQVERPLRCGVGRRIDLPGRVHGTRLHWRLSMHSGIVDRPSNHSVEQTVDRLKSILQGKGVTLFALIDHSGEAIKAGMKMRPTKLLIIGNPKAGTPVMLAAPSSAIDLPLKILIWENAQGKAWVTYNSPAYLQARHNIPVELLPNVSVIEALANGAAE